MLRILSFRITQLSGIVTACVKSTRHLVLCPREGSLIHRTGTEMYLQCSSCGHRTAGWILR